MGPLQRWVLLAKHDPAGGASVLSSNGGFSKTELLIILIVIAVVITLAIPRLRNLKMTLDYRQAARDIASVLRQARSLAIAQNREHRVEFDVAGKKYRMTRGNRASNSSSWPTTIKDWTVFPAGATMRRNSDCRSTSDVNIQFNPDGTANSQYVCVADSTGAMKFRVGVTSAVTGRVKAD